MHDSMPYPATLRGFTTISPRATQKYAPLTARLRAVSVARPSLFPVSHQETIADRRALAMITFTDSYGVYFKEFVSEEACQSAVTAPDYAQSFTFGTGAGAKEYAVFVKMLSVNERQYYAWILCEVSGDRHTVMIALKMPVRISKPLDPKKPIAMLEKFLEKYGTTVHAGHKVARFILHDSIKSKNDISKGMWTINSQGDEFALNAFVKAAKDGDGYMVESFMVFAINLNKYREWASS